MSLDTSKKVKTMTYNGTAFNLGGVSDVTIDGTSIVSNGIADIPFVAGNLGTYEIGVVRPGIGLEAENGDGRLNVQGASTNQINNRQSENPITCNNLDYAVRSVRPVVATLPSTPLVVNTIYDLDEQSSELTLTLPSTAQNGDFIQIDFATSAAITLTLQTGSTILITDYDAQTEANKIYTFFCDWGVCDYGSGAAPSHIYGWRISRAEYELPSS